MNIYLTLFYKISRPDDWYLYSFSYTKQAIVAFNKYFFYTAIGLMDGRINRSQLKCVFVPAAAARSQTDEGFMQ